MKVRVRYDVSPWAAATIFKHRTLAWGYAIVASWAVWLWEWWAIIPVTLVGLARIGHGQWLVYQAGPIVPPLNLPLEESEPTDD